METESPMISTFLSVGDGGSGGPGLQQLVEVNWQPCLVGLYCEAQHETPAGQ